MVCMECFSEDHKVDGCVVEGPRKGLEDEKPLQKDMLILASQAQKVISSCKEMLDRAIR